MQVWTIRQPSKGVLVDDGGQSGARGRKPTSETGNLDYGKKLIAWPVTESHRRWEITESHWYANPPYQPRELTYVGLGMGGGNWMNKKQFMGARTETEEGRHRLQEKPFHRFIGSRHQNFLPSPDAASTCDTAFVSVSASASAAQASTMEVFGLKSQSLRYKMDGFGAAHYLAPHDYFGFAPATSHHLVQAAAAAAMSSTEPAQPKTTLVVGASRGIGKELVQQLSQLQQHGRVIASVRSAVDFGSSPNIQSITMDQSSAKSINEAARSIAALDTLIINAAMGDDEQLLDTPDERMAQYMDVNVTGVLRIVKAFLPALKARKTRQIVLVSSTSGSLARQVNAKSGFKGPYAVSKAALNMIAVQLHNELHESDGFTVVPIHPGWVATDMGRISGDGGMPASKSASGILSVIEKLKPQNSATFYNYDGTTLPW
ncbi:hypothetical protein NLG97_g3754 [Lecanicillium saksenae]|uniref:Uncharacterized protein n=1 Tax=Lecanicillium saksenae TaxID=468837 RepID=A0ACC1R158_9HYPO|nr:hypothetical protein NLG97_g3754 [Lecanicillium saksenae]